MSSHLSGKPVRPQRVRYDGGVSRQRQEEKGEEEVNMVYVNESVKDSHSKEATGDQAVQRAITIERGTFIAAAVCLTVLCALLAVRTIDMALRYHSDNKQLLNNLTLTLTRLNNMTIERNQLQSEVNQLKREHAVESCPTGWQKFGDSFYYRPDKWITWDESREQCLKTGADLVVINSEEEQEFIRGLGDGNGSPWIGLKRSEGKWTWVDGTPLTTQFWGRGLPVDDGEKNCAYYKKNDQGWKNGKCSLLAPWICEKK